MQAWQQVIVRAGQHKGKAGVIQGVREEDGKRIATVKLDTEAEPKDFAEENLTLQAGT